MSLYPKPVDFSATWPALLNTVEKLVKLKPISMEDWGKSYNDIYSLCVAHPEPLAAKLYQATKEYLNQYVIKSLSAGPTDSTKTPKEGLQLLIDYYLLWKKYTNGIGSLNKLYW